MGIFSKLFGKKEEENLDLDFNNPLPGEKGLPLDQNFPQDNLGLEENPLLPESTPTTETGLPPHLEEPAPITTPATPATSPQRDLELINSKLDTLKAILNSMDQRIANLEKAAGVEQNKKMPW